jgi:AraC family transcriptional activator of tynA and feaB
MGRVGNAIEARYFKKFGILKCRVCGTGLNATVTRASLRALRRASFEDLQHWIPRMAMILQDSAMPLLAYEEWRGAIHSAAGRYNPEVVDPAAFAGRICTGRKYGFDVLQVDHNVHRIRRTERDVRLDGVEYYHIVLQVVGQSTVLQNDQDVTLDVGDAVLIDSTRPVTYGNDAYAQWLSMQLPRRSLMSYLGSEPQGGSCGRRSTRAGRILCELLLNEFSDDLSAASVDAYMQLVIYDLVGALFAPPDLPSVSSYSDKLFTRICEIVRDRFTDPDLGPCGVAAEARISLRYLQKIFTQRGSTCGHLINSMRLDHAALLLRRRAFADTGQSVAEIAYACGFNDCNYFSRSFRQRFGHAPSVRAEGGSPELDQQGTCLIRRSRRR